MGAESSLTTRPVAQISSKSREHSVAVVGGGLLGAAIAWGLARAGERVVVVDEGDIAVRASRGNFALVWVQGKGMGMPPHYNLFVSNCLQINYDTNFLHLIRIHLELQPL